MRLFLYWRDPLFLFGCSVYAINRWMIKPYVNAGFFHSHFNDLWLIPCALPPILWLHRWLGLRSHDDVPQLFEITTHLVFWSALFEWIGPKLLSHTTGDWIDVIAYATGAIMAACFWHREHSPGFCPP